MEREIKFRVWNAKDGWYFSDREAPTLKGDGRFDCEMGLHDHLIAELYTGLKDINGTDIYEGDILKSVHSEKPCNYIVKWGDSKSDYCGFILNPVMKNPPRITYHIHNFKMWMANGFEVIGNVNENKELTQRKV